MIRCILPDLWWAIVRESQYKLGFDLKKLKELVKNRFYPVFFSKAKEKKFMQLH